MHTKYKNWSGNIAYSTVDLKAPETIEQLQDIVRASEKVKALGSRHSFNRIADTRYTLLSMNKLNRVIELDKNNHTVTVEGGIRYGELAEYLHQQGFALHNLASLPHISVAGSITTATHGSGNKNGNLATAVTALEFIMADGETRTVSRKDDSDNFNSIVVGLGGIGIISKITLDIVPSFEMYQQVYLDLPFTQLDAHFDEITDSAYSVSMFTQWKEPKIHQVWQKHQVSDDTSQTAPSEFFTAKLAQKACHPLPDGSPENCTQQLGIVGAWHERLPHFRLEFTPSQGAELQSEYFVPRQHALSAIHALAEIGDKIATQLFTSEIRTIAADDLWLSPCYQQDCVAFHFTWKQNWEEVKTILTLIESQLAPYDVMPHWGKLFTMSPEIIQTRYTNLPAFKQHLQNLDPTGKFRNDFLDTYV